MESVHHKRSLVCIPFKGVDSVMVISVCDFENLNTLEKALKQENSIDSSGYLI